MRHEKPLTHLPILPPSRPPFLPRSSLPSIERIQNGADAGDRKVGFEDGRGVQTHDRDGVAWRRGMWRGGIVGGVSRNGGTFIGGRAGGIEGMFVCVHVPGRTPALYKLLPSFLMRKCSSAHVRVSSLVG